MPGGEKSPKLFYLIYYGTETAITEIKELCETFIYKRKVFGN